MAKAKEVEVDPDVVPTKNAKELVTADMVQAAEASADNRREAKKSNGREGVGVVRKKGGTGITAELRVSDIPYPVAVHGENFEFYGPSGGAAEIPEGTEIASYSGEQEFVINPDKVKFLSFDKPGRNLPKDKRLYTVKALHKDGRFVELGFEEQIQNTAGGDIADAIGLRRYVRKGVHVFMDFETMKTVYCAARGCFAQAMQDGNYVNFCSMKHAKFTMPNAYKGGDGISQGLMESGVTTSRVWG